jgi:hypothetical protein
VQLLGVMVMVVVMVMVMIEEHVCSFSRREITSSMPRGVAYTHGLQ